MVSHRYSQEPVAGGLAMEQEKYTLGSSIPRIFPLTSHKPAFLLSDPHKVSHSVRTRQRLDAWLLSITGPDGGAASQLYKTVNMWKTSKKTNVFWFMIWNIAKKRSTQLKWSYIGTKDLNPRFLVEHGPSQG